MTRSTPTLPRRRARAAAVARAAATAAALPALLALSACGHNASLPVEAGFGPTPTLPAPQTSALPTVHIATATGWPDGAAPQPAEGLRVQRFAAGLQHPRWLHVLPNGDVLVAETDAPPKPEDGRGVRGWVMKHVMKRAGSGHPSANRVTLLRDADGDGVAETRTPLLEGLNSPFGLAQLGTTLYVADTDAVLKVPFTPGRTAVDGPPVKVVDLPAGAINHHWTKNVVASPDGARLYVTVGSNSNVAENGLAAEAGRAAIWEVDPATGAHAVFASGLRNPNGMAWEPATGALWTVVNERDELGGDLVPDYLTAVVRGGFYGWPWSWYGAHVDDRVQPPRPDMVAKARVPDYALGAHTASLGLAVSTGQRLSPAFAQGMFIGQHGSWNRNPRSGYQVIFVPFEGGRPSGKPLPVLTGFVQGDDARGRPVGVAVDRLGGLLVADDVGGMVWRVSAAGGASAAATVPAMPASAPGARPGT